MPGRYREHLVQIGTFDDVEPADKCLRLRRPGANVPTGSVGSSSSQTIIKYFMGATCLPVSPSEELTGSPFNIMSHPPT